MNQSPCLAPALRCHYPLASPSAAVLRAPTPASRLAWQRQQQLPTLAMFLFEPVNNKFVCALCGFCCIFLTRMPSGLLPCHPPGCCTRANVFHVPICSAICQPVLPVSNPCVLCTIRQFKPLIKPKAPYSCCRAAVTTAAQCRRAKGLGSGRSVSRVPYRMVCVRVKEREYNTK